MDNMQVELIAEQLMQQMAGLGDKIITHRKGQLQELKLTTEKTVIKEW